MHDLLKNTYAFNENFEINDGDSYILYSYEGQIIKKRNFSLQDLTGRLNQVAFSNTVNKDITKFIKTYYKKDFSKFSKEKLINIVVNCLKN